MTLPPPNVCRRVRQLHALIGSTNAHEAEAARTQLSRLLAEHGLTWNDLPAILAASDTGGSSSAAAAPHRPAAGKPSVNVLDLALVLIEQHVMLMAEQRMAVALWLLHTHVFDRFAITPRLALLSPVRGCGKTTLLDLLELLAAAPYRTDNVTPAAIYYLLDRRPHALLVDEADNLGLLANPTLRAVFNSGHRRGGAVSRFAGGWSRRFPTFAPLAVAAIGTLPLPLLHRAIIIDMQRAAPDEKIQQLDDADPSFATSREEIGKWAATCSLARAPEMPTELRNRAADNWRVLLSIADDLGRGAEARAAAIALSANRPDEDPGVTLLADVRTIFAARRIDRIASAQLIEALCTLDDAPWYDWRGLHDDQTPHRLTQGDLARLLRPFGIRSRTVWPAHRGPGAKSSRGYLRSQFERAWATYCPPDTATQESKIRRLPRG